MVLNFHIYASVKAKTNSNNISSDDSNSAKKKILDILVDCAVVAGIAMLATGFIVNPEVSWKVALASFAMSFLLKLKELRGITDIKKIDDKA